MEGSNNMLTIFICPKCYNYRIVSRKPDATCFHCGAMLHRSDIDFIEFTDMSEQERSDYKQKFIQRMKIYKDNTENLLAEQEVK